MFQARLSRLVEFRKMIDVIKDLVPDMNFEAKETGLTIMGTDTLNIVQLTIDLPACYFDEYVCEGNLVMSLSLLGMSQFLKLGDPEDALILSSKADMTVLNMLLEAPKHPKICQFTLNLNSVELEDVSAPDLPQTSLISINSRELHSICVDLSHLAEFLCIEINKARVKFSIKCQAAGGHISYKQRKGENGTHIRTFRTVKAELNLAYLKRITRACSLSDKVEIYISPDEPVLLRYKIGEGEIKYHLAPGISDEE